MKEEDDLQRTILGTVRKIILGELDALKPYQFQVGHKYLNPENQKYITITEIIRDDNAYFLFGNLEYYIYAKEDGDTESFLWKSEMGHKVVVEYSKPIKC